MFTLLTRYHLKLLTLIISSRKYFFWIKRRICVVTSLAFTVSKSGSEQILSILEEIWTDFRKTSWKQPIYDCWIDAKVMLMVTLMQILKVSGKMILLNAFLLMLQRVAMVWFNLTRNPQFVVFLNKLNFTTQPNLVMKLHVILNCIKIDIIE